MTTSNRAYSTEPLLVRVRVDAKHPGTVNQMLLKFLVLILGGARLNGLLEHRVGRSPKHASGPVDHIVDDGPLEDEMDDFVEEASELERLEQAFIQRPSTGHDHLGRFA